MNWQSNNVYEVNEDDLFDFAQKYTLYLLKNEEENEGLHPSVEQKDKWICKYAKNKFKLIRDE